MKRNRNWTERLVTGALKFPIMIGFLIGLILLLPLLYLELIGCKKGEKPWLVTILTWVDETILLK